MQAVKVLNECDPGMTLCAAESFHSMFAKEKGHFSVQRLAVLINTEIETL